MLGTVPVIGSTPVNCSGHLHQEVGPLVERVLRRQHAGRLLVQRAPAAPHHPARNLWWATNPRCICSAGLSTLKCCSL